MADIWFISDTHFFHENILRFTDKDGALIRGKRFSTVHEMNECLVENWNSLIKPQDKVYHLGDVGVGVRRQSDFSELVKSLHGNKRLLLGNHDHIEGIAYRHFERIELWTGGKFKQYNFVASHIPLRPDQMRNVEYNVHGHIHQKLVRLFIPSKFRVVDDTHYINVCVEHTDYKPVHLEDIIARIKSGTTA